MSTAATGALGSDTRDRLEAAQEAVLAHLLAAAPVPDGFDAGRLAVERQILHRRRRRSVAAHLPLVAVTLADRFGVLFAAYAAGHAPAGGARQDAARFGQWLLEEGHLTRRQWRRLRPATR